MHTSVVYTLPAYSSSFAPVAVYFCKAGPDIDKEITMRFTYEGSAGWSPVVGLVITEVQRIDKWWFTTLVYLQDISPQHRPTTQTIAITAYQPTWPHHSSSG
jgi:hypothetical protein